MSTNRISIIKTPPGETTKIARTVTDPLKAERIVFDGIPRLFFQQEKGVEFNLWLNNIPFSISQLLRAGDVVCLEVINHSGMMFETLVRLIGKSQESSTEQVGDLMSKKVNVIAGFEHKGWSSAFCPVIRSAKTNRLLLRLINSLSNSGESAAHSAQLVAEYHGYTVDKIVTSHEI